MTDVKSRGAAGRAHYVLLGPLPPPVGGATVLFKQLVEDLRSRTHLEITVIDTSRKNVNAAFSVMRAIQVSWQLLRCVRSCDVVSFHTSRRGAVLFGPIVWGICHLFRKPWIFRGFGDFETWHKSAGRPARFVFDHTALQADAVLFETKAAVAVFRQKTSATVHWYANNRPIGSALHTQEFRGASRFVFVGHVKPSKGVRELIEAARLVKHVAVDVYGPLLEGMHDRDFLGGTARYRGVLAPEQVEATLRNYDALVFPTYYEGEGYPGIILEAYSAGLAVITTRWRCIPEIVTDRSGILVEPQDVGELAAAMRHLSTSPECVMLLRNGAKDAAAAFSSDIWTDRFLEISAVAGQIV